MRILQVMNVLRLSRRSIIEGIESKSRVRYRGNDHMVIDTLPLGHLKPVHRRLRHPSPTSHRAELRRSTTTNMPLHDALRQRMQPVAQAITSQRFFIYAVLSTLAVIAVIANACRNYSNFYSVSIYLGKSGRSVVVSPFSCHPLFLILKPACYLSLDLSLIVSCKLLLSLGSVMWQGYAEDFLWPPSSSRSRSTSRVLNCRVRMWYISLSVIATVRPDMDVRDGIPTGVHNLPRRIRHSFWCYVWLLTIRQVFPLAYER
jgi:hypothetical protein